MTETLKGHNVPQNKKQLIEQINKAGIADILCTSNLGENGRVTFSIEIRTKDHKCFILDQDVWIKPVLSRMEVLDFSTGDGYEVEANLGTGFNPKKYKVMDKNWSLEGQDD